MKEFVENLPLIIIFLCIIAGDTALCLLVKRKWMHWIPVMLFAFLTIVFLVHTLLANDWSALAYILLFAYSLVCGGVAAAGVIIGSVIRYIIKKKKQKKVLEETEENNEQAIR